MSFALALAVLTLVLWIVGGGEVFLGSRRIDFLRDVPIDRRVPGPTVSLVVAARNEAAKVGAGIESLLAQEEIDLQLVVVDDRSEDLTGEILDAMALEHRNLGVVHVEELPPGWLGKTHALHLGAAAARGEWLLFADADVVLAPRAVARAVAYASARNLDHLAVTPELSMPTRGSDLFGGTFVLLFSRFATPWKARNPRSRAHIGIGAFNLVRASAYRSIGGHERVRLRPDDDMRLGKALKEAGFRQDVAYGTDQVEVEWYGSLGEAVRGLEKNAFAGMGYSAPAVLAACAAILLFTVWPWIALFIVDGTARMLYGASVVIMVFLYVSSSRSSGANPWLAPAIPFAICVFCYTLLRSSALALVRGEIRWRGTAYSLDELRRFEA